MNRDNDTPIGVWGDEYEDRTAVDETDNTVRRFVYLEDFGVTLPLFLIQSVEKQERFKENSLGGGRWEYGISINTGVTGSSSNPKNEIEAWYPDFSVRDRKYKKLLSKLDELGFKVTKI